jgi:hypothetical protein
MEQLITAIISILTGLGPVSALGWLLAIGQGVYILQRLRSDTSLQDKIVDAHKIHSETVKALQEDRIADLKDLLDKYESTVNKLAEAMEKRKRP